MAPHRRLQRAHRRQTRQLVGAPRKEPAVGFDEPSAGNVEEWVFRFLGNLAAIEERKRCLVATVRFPKSKHSKFRSPTPYSWDERVIATRSCAQQHRNPEDSDDETDVLLPSRNAKSVEAAYTARNSSGDDGRDRTLLQRINRYIRAGIAEGKRRAKRYVQRALSFALETGYLVPADREGKLLRVSRSLVKATASAEKLAKKRKRAAKLEKAGAASKRRQRGKKPSEESSLAQSRKTPRSAGGSRKNDGTSSSRSGSPRSGREERMSASKVEGKPMTLQPVVDSTRRPRSAPNARGPE